MSAYIDACDALQQVHDLSLVLNDYLTRRTPLDDDRRNALGFLSGSIVRASREALAAIEAEAN